MPDSAPRRARGWRAGAALLTRLALGHAGSVILYVVNLVLVALGALFIYVALREDLPVPGFLHGRIQQELAQRGFEAPFASARFDPTGRIMVENVSLVPNRYGEPVLAAARVFVHFDRLKLLAGRVELRRLDAEDVRVICPARISPSGTPETLLRIGSVRLEQHAGTWSLPGLIARLGPLGITARGSYTPERGRPPGAPPDVAAALDYFEKYAPKVSRALTQVTGFEEPHLDVVFQGAAGAPLHLSAAFSVASWRDPRFGEVQRARAQTELTLGAEPAAPLRVTARLDSFARPDTGTAEHVALMAEWLGLPSAEHPWPWQVHATATRYRHPKVTVDDPVVALFPLAFPLVETSVSCRFEGRTLAVQAVGDAKTRSGEVWASGSAGPTWLPRLSEIVGSDLTRYAEISAPPDFAAHARFDAGLRWNSAEFRVLGGPIVARDVPLDRLRVVGEVDPDRVRITRLEIARGDETVRGTYESDFHVRNYRFRLGGAARPHSIAPWFGPWWTRFWKDYRFAGAVPRFDVDAQGNWLKPDPILVSGSGAADDVSYRDVALAHASLRFFIRPLYYDLYDATLERPEGRLDGEIRLRFPRGEANPLREDFRFTSTADLVDLARVFGPGGEAWLAPYRYQVPPAVTASGTITRDADDDQTDVQLDLGIETAHEFRYHDFPLDALSTRVRIHNRHVELPGIRAAYADGVLTGLATVDAGRINFDARLADADFDRAMQVYSDFIDRNFPTPPEESAADGGLARESYGGRLTLHLAAAGPLDDFKAYEGGGELGITGAKLYQFKAIGIFGDLFERFGLNVGRLDFTDATSPLEIRRDIIHFPDLRVTGKTGRLEAIGDYSLRDRTIDFSVRMKPLRETKGFLTQIVGIVINPLTDLLFEARLGGTLRNPERHIVFFAPRRSEAPESPPVPEPGATTAPVPELPPLPEIPPAPAAP